MLVQCSYWWFTKPGSEERKKAKLVIDLGPLVGKAVTIVTTSDSESPSGWQAASLPCLVCDTLQLKQLHLIGDDTQACILLAGCN
jgi:hypothetical protein